MCRGMIVEVDDGSFNRLLVLGMMVHHDGSNYNDNSSEKRTQ